MNLLQQEKERRVLPGGGDKQKTDAPQRWEHRRRKAEKQQKESSLNAINWWRKTWIQSYDHTHGARMKKDTIVCVCVCVSLISERRVRQLERGIWTTAQRNLAKEEEKAKKVGKKETNSSNKASFERKDIEIRFSIGQKANRERINKSTTPVD